MSSIFGVFNRQKNPVSSELLNRVCNKLSYWNPDRSAIWNEKNIGLGHLMLCITPESLDEKLPYKEDNLVITSNARIDNRNELIELLGMKAPAKEITDSRLILKAYQKWKENCPKYLIGEFVFAIWDEQNQRLFCAKDHIGTRPLYYYNSPEHFIFSSEIKGIFETGLVNREYNELMLAVYLIGYKGEKEQTTFKNIFSLPGAHWLMVSPGNFKIERYWDFDYSTEIKLKDNKAYEEAFTELLIQAVKRRSRSAFPIGHLLSGGLDSTAVAGVQIKEKLQTTPLFLYSWVHDENVPKEYPDDREYINDFLKFHFGKNFKHVFQSGYTSYFKRIPEIQKYCDEPFRDLEHCTRFYSYEQAQMDNVRTLMGGIGGDELASSVADEYCISSLFELKFGKAINELYAIKKLRKKSYKSVIKTNIINPFVSFVNGTESWGKGHPACGRNYLDTREQQHYIQKPFLNEVGLHNFIAAHPSTSYLPARFSNPLKQKLYLNMSSGSFEMSFNQRYNNSLTYKMLYTYPLLDRDLISFLMRLPNNQFYQNGIGRSIIRRSMKNYVPRSILTRTSKFATSPNLDSNMRRECSWLLSELTEWKKEEFISKIIDLDKLQQDIKSFISGNNTNAEFIRTFFLIFFLKKTYYTIHL